MDISRLSYSEEAVMDDVAPANQGLLPPRNPDASQIPGRSPRPPKTRSLSDGGNTPKLSPSPHIIEAARRASKDDTNLHNVTALPVMPLRNNNNNNNNNNFALRGLSLQTTSTRDFAVSSPSAASSASGSIRPTAGATAGSVNLSGGSGGPGGSGIGNVSGGGRPRGGGANSAAATHQSSSININTSGAFPSTTSQASASPASTSAGGFLKPTTTPVSPKLDHSQIYASPTNILPRRSRGLDFSRAATSLHHSTLADQASPDSSPTIGAGRISAMNIPGRRDSTFGPDSQTSHSSLWGVMGGAGMGPQSNNPSGHGIGNHGYNNSAHMSGSLGSSINMPMASDSSTSSDEDDFMDDDMDEAFVTTPQVAKTGTPMRQNMMHRPGGVPWMTGNGSPAPAGSGTNSTLNSPAFQRPQRRIKQSKTKLRGAGGGPLGLGLSASAAAAGMSKTPPNNLMMKDMPHARRESISWAANQLHISSGNDSDDTSANSGQGGAVAGAGAAAMDQDGIAPSTPSRPNVIRRTVTRRQNLLPKTKGFARIKAELIEESTPMEADLRRESQVIRQVRESDMDLEPRISATTTALSSPLLGASDDVGDMMPMVPDDMMMTDSIPGGAGGGGSSTFKQQAFRNSKGSKAFWDTFSECSSLGGSRTTPPPPGPQQSQSQQQGNLTSRGSTAAPFGDDMNMDSPIPAAKDVYIASRQSSMSEMPMGNNNNRSQSQSDSQHSGAGGTPQIPMAMPIRGGVVPPTAAEITRRINSKRRRDDDFDPVSFKRRAVSPGMSVHNSPVMQSPLQRDVAPWGSRPGSNGGERSSAPSETGSLQHERGGSAARGEGQGQGVNGQGGNGGAGGRKMGRVGFQGMVDTNDGLMRMSIE